MIGKVNGERQSPHPAPRTPHLTVEPLPTPEEAVAIVVALHRHRRQLTTPREPPSGWLRAARREALRPDWSARRGAGWGRSAR
jgi:hypothetical protein